MTTPLVSIIIPSLNQGAFIAQTIESVLRQSPCTVEIIVMDGCSQDNTHTVLQHYRRHLTHCIEKRDAGQSDAINKGIALASGTYVNWLGADDMLTDGALVRMTAMLDANRHLAGVFGNARIIDSNGVTIVTRREIPFDRTITVYGLNYSLQPSAIFRREAFLTAGPLKTDLHFTMDHELWLRMWDKGLRFGFMADELSLYRYHAASKGTSASRSKINAERLWIRRNYGKHIPNPYAERSFHILMAVATRILRKSRQFQRYGSIPCIPLSARVAWRYRTKQL